MVLRVQVLELRLEHRGGVLRGFRDHFFLQSCLFCLLFCRSFGRFHSLNLPLHKQQLLFILLALQLHSFHVYGQFSCLLSSFLLLPFSSSQLFAHFLKRFPIPFCLPLQLQFALFKLRLIFLKVTLNRGFHRRDLFLHFGSHFCLFSAELFCLPQQALLRGL